MQADWSDTNDLWLKFDYTANPFPVMTTGISLCVILPCNDPVKITW